jgi:hypothetical protein
VDSWKPLEDKLSVSKEVVRFVLLLQENSRAYSDNVSFFRDNLTELAELRKRLLADFLLPRITQSFDSSRWNPVHDTEVALQLYESIKKIIDTEVESSLSSKKTAEHDAAVDNLQSVFPTTMPSSVPFETEDSMSHQLSNLVKTEMVHKIVYQRLTIALSQWEPRLTKGNREENDQRREVADRPDLWILPWIPHLTDRQALLTQLVSDCKRKVKGALSFLQKTFLSSSKKKKQEETNNDKEFLNACIRLLRPWRGIFKKESIHSMVANSVTARLARYLSSKVSMSSVLGLDGQIFQWADLDILYRMHNLRLVSDSEFLSIVEGEILTSWAAAIHQWLSEKRQKDFLDEAAHTYMAWKCHILQASPVETSNNGSNHNNSSIDGAGSSFYASSNLLLQQDTRICACFYAVLLMIQAAFSSNVDVLDDLCPPNKSNYRVVLARRQTEVKQTAADDLVRMNATGTVNGT